MHDPQSAHLVTLSILLITISQTGVTTRTTGDHMTNTKMGCQVLTNYLKYHIQAQFLQDSEI
jgi:hypothetical protein